MRRLKRSVKNLFVQAGFLPVLDRLLYLRAKWQNRAANRRFQQEDPAFRLPPDYYLYETYKLNYREYRDDGLETAREMLDWSARHGCRHTHILEWGCGVGRIIRHLPRLSKPGTGITGVDINPAMIGWNSTNLPGIAFHTIDYNPPTPFADGSFDLIYALSVFTHIEREHQHAWLQEMHRLLQPGGLFLFTTHGHLFVDQLSPEEQDELNRTGCYTISYRQRGHRMMTTYHEPTRLRSEAERFFTILEYYDGAMHPNKAGGQDLWIVQKKPGAA